jgi:hypothetical protein
MQGDNTVKAKVACQDFLTLWKDPDPDAPVLVADNPIPSGENCSNNI